MVDIFRGSRTGVGRVSKKNPRFEIDTIRVSKKNPRLKIDTIRVSKKILQLKIDTSGTCSGFPLLPKQFQEPFQEKGYAKAYNSS
jgi:hypothetical protein